MKWIVVGLLLSSWTAMAEKPWPIKVVEPHFESCLSASFPIGLQKILLTYDDYEQGTKQLPEELEIFRVRLSSSGLMDYFVEVPQGFSGGAEVHIFESKRGAFTEIGGGQGLQYFGPRENGYYQLIFKGRGGAGAVLRTLFQFKNNHYRIVRMTDYQLQDDHLDFVRERSPTEFR